MKEIQILFKSGQPCTRNPNCGQQNTICESCNRINCYGDIYANENKTEFFLSKELPRGYDKLQKSLEDNPMTN